MAKIVELHQYQKELVKKIGAELEKKTSKTVLAAAPGAGKTVMTCEVLENYLRDNPREKVLILAHGTKLLRSQFYNALIEQKTSFDKVIIEPGKVWDKDAPVQVCIPQTIQGRRDLPEFSLLVVDEAHEYYDADMVTRIIKRSKVKHQLLLTGTPSSFIYHNKKHPNDQFTIFTKPLTEIMEEAPGQISDLFVELAVSSYTFTRQDYNDEDNLKMDIFFPRKATEATMDAVVQKLIEHLVQKKAFLYSSKIGYQEVFKHLDKSMIACENIEQGEQVRKVLEDHGVNCTISHSKNTRDRDDMLNSKNIERFKTDPDIKVLVVVDRGILGFDFADMVNVVDMTNSLNINRVYQLLARVVRKHPTVPIKTFVKVSPPTRADYMPDFMCAVGALMARTWFEAYDGRNFLKIPIPKIEFVPRQWESRKRPPEPPTPPPPPVFKTYIGVPFLKWSECIYDPKVSFHPRHFTTLGQIKIDLGEAEDRLDGRDLEELFRKTVEAFTAKKRRKAA